MIKEIKQIIELIIGAVCDELRRRGFLKERGLAYIPIEISKK